MTRPSDIPPWALEAARNVVVGGPLSSVQANIARAVLSAKLEGMEKAAEIAETMENLGPAFSAAQAIRQAAKEVTQ